MKIYLVFKDEKSSKFWQIEVKGKKHTVTFGKTGTKGQSKDKEFNSKKEAEEDAEKLITQKLKKGYEKLSAPGKTAVVSEKKTKKATVKKTAAKIKADGGKGEKKAAKKTVKKTVKKVVKKAVKKAALKSVKKTVKKTVKRKTASGEGKKSLKIYDHILNAGDLKQALVEHFSFLADNKGFEPVLEAVMARAHEVNLEGVTLQVEFPGRKTLVCSPPADPGDYAAWPKSFQNIVKHHETLAYPETGWSLNLGDVGNFEVEFLEDADSELLEYVDDPSDILCPITDYSDWWLYHPSEVNPAGEPALCFFSHEGGDIEDPVNYNAGSYFLMRIAGDLGCETVIPEIKGSVPDADELLAWYGGLEPAWQEVIRRETDSEDPDEHILLRLLKSREIHVGDSEIDSLKPLEKFTRLEELTAFNSPVTSLEGTSHLKGLKKLKLDNTKITDFTLLENFPRLQKLSLDKCALSSVTDLPLLPVLRELEINNTGIRDLGGVERFKKLEALEFDNTGVSSMEPLRSLKGINHVSFSHTSVSDLSPLYGKKEMHALVCQNAPVPLVELLNFNASIVEGENDELIPFFGLVLFADATEDDKILREGITGLPRLNGEQCDILGKLVNERLVSRLKKEEYEEAIDLLEAFLDLPAIELSENIRAELGGNSMILVINFTGKDLAEKVFSRLVPEEVKEKRLAYNLACWYAGEKEKEQMLRFTKTALELGFETERFGEKDFDNFREDPDFIELISKPQVPDPRVDPEKWFSLLNEETRECLIWKAGNGNEPDFKKILDLEELHGLRDVTSLEPFRYLTKLKKLSVEYSSYSSIEPLKDLVNLEELKLTGEHYTDNKKIVNIEPLANLTKLRELVVTNQKVDDIGPLKNLKNLRTLDLTANNITDITPLGGLVKLEDLSLRGNRIGDLHLIADLKELTRLDVILPGNSDFEFIRGLKKLTNLWAGDAVTSLEPFEDLPDLTYLCLSGRKIDPGEAEDFQKRHPHCDLEI